MPMRPKQLLEACEEILKSFDPRICTVDAHVEEKLGDCSSEVRRLRVAAAVRSGGVRANSTPGIALLTVLHPRSLPHITRMPIQTKYSYSRCSTAVYATRRPSRCAPLPRSLAPRCRFIKPPGHCSTVAPLSLNHAARTSLSLRATIFAHRRPLICYCCCCCCCCCCSSLLRHCRLPPRWVVVLLLLSLLPLCRCSAAALPRSRRPLHP